MQHTEYLSNISSQQLLISLVVVSCFLFPLSGTGLAAGGGSTGVENTPPARDSLSSDTSSVDLEKYKWVAGQSSTEAKIFRVLNTHFANPALDAVMPIITDFRRNRIFVLMVWAALVIFGGSRGRWAALMLIPLIAASDQLSSSLLKPLFARIRPCEILGEIRLWHGAEGWITTSAETARSYKGSFSFPSGHATNITASMLFLSLVYRKLIIPLLVLALAVSYSRIYVGVHWPLDVLAGMATGAALAFPAYFLYQWLRGIPPRKSKLPTSPGKDQS